MYSTQRSLGSHESHNLTKSLQSFHTSFRNFLINVLTTKFTQCHSIIVLQKKLPFKSSQSSQHHCRGHNCPTLCHHTTCSTITHYITLCRTLSNVTTVILFCSSCHILLSHSKCVTFQIWYYFPERYLFLHTDYPLCVQKLSAFYARFQHRENIQNT